MLIFQFFHYKDLKFLLNFPCPTVIQGPCPVIILFAKFSTPYDYFLPYRVSHSKENKVILL